MEESRTGCSKNSCATSLHKQALWNVTTEAVLCRPTYLFQVLLQSCLSICDLLDPFVEGVVDYIPLFQYVLLGLAEYAVNDTTQGGGSDSLLLCLTYVDI